MQTGWLKGVVMGSLIWGAPWALAQADAASHAQPPASGFSAPRGSSSPAAVPVRPPARPARILSSGHAAGLEAGEPAMGQVLREIDDPDNGDRWLLVEDTTHPGGPGRLELARTPSEARKQAPAGGAADLPQPPRQEPSAPDSALPVIRSGDRVVVEQHTRFIDASLETVALGPARAGATFTARLRMGGGLVRAVAVAPGRAVLAEEAQP